ncbi:TetR/AcrR family transcriptional regulator [uncultured Ralstonia sp.]|jgi:AcrR family transcriptional regulator|uniref:TetR/AcrR family transcriptional regulator n=1 Tax=Ralstonia sp. TaxID=54061 RepID=UPI0025FD6BD4|nr:TetR/AcrR family transcriptional regulator [uncultured Ralstonia sp.]
MAPQAKEKLDTDQALVRRQPRQARSREKVELILEATQQILDQEGLDALTTNRIAEVAGISIGTLYQYFGDKRQVLDDLAQRESEHLTAELLAVLTAPELQAPDARLRQVIRTLLGAFGGRHKVRRIVLEQAIARGRNPLITPGHVSTFLSSTGLRDTDGRRVTLTAIQAFVLTRAIMGAIGSALSYDERWLASADFEDSLFALVRGFLRACGDASAPAPAE